VRAFGYFVVGRRANLKYQNGNSNLTIIGGDVAEAAADAAATAGVKRVFHLAAHVGSVTSAIGSAGHGDGRGVVVCRRFFSSPLLPEDVVQKSTGLSVGSAHDCSRGALLGMAAGR
jgi:hypothetical protein